MAKGDTKTNDYLDIAAHGDRNDFPASCCETRSQTLIREVGERIMDLEDEVERLENNPDVADIVATYADLQAYDTSQLTDKDVIRVLQDETHDGDSTYYRYDKQTDTWTYIGESKQYTNFVGTDGTAAGEAGLVPAPATTDAGKFLSASGLWEDVAGGGGVTVLTADDYNYPTDNPTKIAAWLLDDGLYEFESVTIANNTYYEDGNLDPANTSSVVMFEVSSNATNGRKTMVGYYENNGIMLYPSFSMTVNASTGVKVTNGFYYNLSTHSVEQSTGTNTSRPMSQNAVTSMVFADPSTKRKVQIGEGASAGGANAIALGSFSVTTQKGQMDISALGYGGAGTVGYNDSNYRLLTGLYDGQSAHDAATKGQLDTAIINGGTTAPTTATVGAVGTLYSYVDTTGATPEPHLMVCTVADTVTPSYTWVEAGGGQTVTPLSDNELNNLWEEES